MAIKIEDIEGTMKDLISEIKDALNIEAAIDGDLCPGEVIASDALMTITGRLNARLGTSIPLNFQPFQDKQRNQLTIKRAAEKVFNQVKDGK